MNSLKSTLLGALMIFFISASLAQVNDTPNAPYEWKKNKTEFQEGYVVLKSGKRMDGKISLKGSPDKVDAIFYQNGGQSLTFPPGSLQSYGLTIAGVSKAQLASSASGPVNESPESMYDWRFVGIVMNKEIHTTTPRPGYVVLKDGTRHEGELKLKKKAGVLDDFEVKTASGREKVNPDKVAKYGYTISQEEIDQQNLSKQVGKSWPGRIVSGSDTEYGDIDIQDIAGKPYVEKIFFIKKDGKLEVHTPQTISAFSITDKKGESNYVVIDGVFVEQSYDGNTFKCYLNPKPTTINKFATGLAKTTVAVGTQVAASEILSADEKKHNYTSNMDSIIEASSTEDLIKLRDELAKLGGYSSAEEAMDKSDSESLKANIGALDVAIAGRRIQESEGGILNKEWIILNKKTNEKLVVYRSDYDNQILNLLMGCEKYLVLSKSEQKNYTKWDNIEQALKFLDGCY